MGGGYLELLFWVGGDTLGLEMICIVVGFFVYAMGAEATG